MKRIVPILLILIWLGSNLNSTIAQEKVLANKNPYGKLWTRLDSLLSKNANADSILGIVNRISSMATSQNDIPSIIKTTYYKAVLISNNRVKGRYDAIAYVESELKRSKGLLTTLLQSMLADLYLKLENDYSYSSSNKDSLTDNIRLWSKNQINSRINELLLLSLANEQSKTVDIRTFDVFDGNAYEERPTLFDYLSYYAIENYKKQDWNRFIKFDPLLFSVDDFLSKPEPKYTVQSIYYRLLKFHRKDNNLRAFVHAEVNRLSNLQSNLIWQQGIDSLYISSLEKLGKRYFNSDAYVEVVAALAKQYWEEFTGWFYEDALTTKLDRCEKLLDDALLKKVNSPAYETCKNLKKNLSASYIEAEMNQGIYPKAPILAKIKWRNISKVNIAIKGDSYFEKSTVNVSKRFNSYYQLDTIPVCNGLTKGKYTIQFHAGIDTDTLTIPIVITNILSYGVTLNDSLIGVTVDRKTGATIPNTAVFIDERKWNHDLENDTTIRSNEQGFYSYKFPPSNYSQINIEVDNVRMKYPVWSPKLDRINSSLTFTDRSIYRPGQTIYYKSTVFQQDIANNFYKSNEYVPYLSLSNGRKIHDESPGFAESLDGKSKIFFGKFNIPLDAPLGEAIISGDDYRSRKIIHIEEYKRPTFEVKIDSLLWDKRVKRTYIKGFARGYVGQAIDSARVSLSVKEPLDTTITCYTDQQGFFKCFITQKKIYHSLEANVTSQSGETQSTKFSGFAREPLSLQLYISDTVNITDRAKINIDSQDYFVKGELRIAQLVKGEYCTVLTIPYSGKGSNYISISDGIKSAGKYRISYHSQGKELASKFFTVIDRGDIRKVYLDKEVYEVGDIATLTVLTPKNVKALLFFEKNGHLWKHLWIDTCQFQYKIPITRYEQIGYRVMMTNNFKTSEYSGYINISDKTTKLNIEMLSYRNKLLPNSNEKWTIKVTDSNGKPVLADITAAMYDASLDAYFPNVWLTNSLYFRNQLFSRSFFVESNETKEAISAWSEEKKVWYGSLMGWSLKPLQASSEKIHPLKPSLLQECMMVGSIQPDAFEATSQPTNYLSKNKFPDIQTRKNIGETIFFYPTLRTDSLGYANISFAMNEALTRWRFMLFAITGKMQYGFTDSYHISQKPLMIKPNPPRFLRVGDKSFFTASIINISDSTINGKAVVEFFDMQTSEVLNADFLKENQIKSFSVEPNKTSVVQWEIQVPDSKRNMIGYRVKAASGIFSDGEENSLPVLSNRELFTESFCFNVAPKSNDKYIFRSLKYNFSNSVQNHNLSFEIIKNPAWEVLYALPYLMTYPYGCSEQKMDKLYANILALSILDKNNDVRSTIDSWAKQGNRSPLYEDSKLKETLTEESPWFSESTNESQRKADMARSLNVEQLRANISKAILELKEQQLPSGFFSWMPGGKPNHYITQLITEKILHLQHLGIKLSEYKLDEMLQKAWMNCDLWLLDEYTSLKKDIATGKQRYEANHLSPLIIHQLYTNSFLNGKGYFDVNKEVYQYYLKQGVAYFDQFSVACQGMIALALYRSGDTLSAKRIINILEEAAFKNESSGMSWDYSPWYWYTLPIESQSIMIEAFHEIKNDKGIEALLKLWLLKNKEANRWPSTKATASAIYALLMIGDKLPVKYEPFVIQIGNDKLDTYEKESESGYIRKQWNGNDINRSKSTVRIENPNDYKTWGNISWQYFENIDKVGASKNESVALTKLLFKEESGKLVQIHDSATINVGDKITVRLIVEARRDMEYIFLKDHRCSGFEPEQKLSGYNWSGMCTYYETVRDASNQFFFDELKKGKYTIEYTMFANLKGSYNNGYANIECIYAPSIRSRTGSLQINITSKK